MHRIDYGITAEEVVKLAEKAKVPVRWAKARCEHGKTRSQTCRYCEMGYVYDTHTFAKLRSNPCIAGVTGDGEDVAYIPQKYGKKVAKVQ